MHIRAMEAGGQRNTIYFTATLLALFIITSWPPSNAEDFDYPSIVKPPHSWTNLAPSGFSFWESAGVRPILLNETFVCGFHCKFEGTACVFAISIFQFSSNDNSSFSPQMVWSANRNNPVRLGAKLQLSQEGDLALQDVDRALVWSTKTTGKSVTGLKLTHQGNLMLIDRNNKTVWQSFDHPTDSLVVGQRLVSRQKLKSNMSAISWSEGIYSFLIDDDGHFVAYMESNATVYKESNANLRYYRSDSPQSRSQMGQFYAELSNVSFGAGLSPGYGVSLIQLGSDGHLRSFGWVDSNWKEVYDLFEYHLDPCDYPLACGSYGICSVGGACSCPEYYPYFEQIDSLQPQLGCKSDIQVSCNSPHQLDQVENLGYSNSAFSSLLNFYSNGTDIESCKQACSNNCSCKYVVFVQHNENFTSSGLCIFGSEGLSFRRTVRSDYNQSVFFKGNSLLVEGNSDQYNPPGVIIGWTLGVAGGFILLLTSSYILLKIKKHPKDVEEDYLSHIPGIPLRFSYEELKVATNNFSNKLGEGGFGCVFQGTLPGGAEVAVKCLDGFGSVKKSFMAEVETIGSIHHFNLVQLVGFCAEKSHMLLVYEYMSKGSLDQWIFCRVKALSLGWQCRRKIILDIANGLAYLHGRCRQKIIHLDIKPQNILLDENFNAKVSDFGLSKLVEREQSHVVTKMRGTPGYMAPEWLNSVITEKVDVYSFGIVVLEILCGRKNVDRSQPEEDSHLVSLFKRKVKDGELLDLVDKYNKEMQSNAAEVMQMMKVAAWCLKDEYAKRPSMSIVLKFLEGKMDGENQYDFSNPPAGAEVVTLEQQVDAVAATASSVIPSILSGPR